MDGIYDGKGLRLKIKQVKEEGSDSSYRKRRGGGREIKVDVLCLGSCDSGRAKRKMEEEITYTHGERSVAKEE